jgi:hypothetical protein
VHDAAVRWRQAGLAGWCEEGMETTANNGSVIRCGAWAWGGLSQSSQSAAARADETQAMVWSHKEAEGRRKASGGFLLVKEPAC